MTHVLIKHKVEDYIKWKSEFDAFADDRKKGGEMTHLILHPQDDPNNLTLLFEFNSRENAEKFLNSSELKQAMDRAGVKEEPQVRYLNVVDRGAFIK